MLWLPPQFMLLLSPFASSLLYRLPGPRLTRWLACPPGAPQICNYWPAMYWLAFSCGSFCRCWPLYFAIHTGFLEIMWPVPTNVGGDLTYLDRTVLSYSPATVLYVIAKRIQINQQPSGLSDSTPSTNVRRGPLQHDYGMIGRISNFLVIEWPEVVTIISFKWRLPLFV